MRTSSSFEGLAICLPESLDSRRYALDDGDRWVRSRLSVNELLDNCGPNRCALHTSVSFVEYQIEGDMLAGNRVRQHIPERELSEVCVLNEPARFGQLQRV